MFADFLTIPELFSARRKHIQTSSHDTRSHSSKTSLLNYTVFWTAAPHTVLCNAICRYAVTYRALSATGGFHLTSRGNRNRSLYSKELITCCTLSRNAIQELCDSIRGYFQRPLYNIYFLTSKSLVPNFLIELLTLFHTLSNLNDTFNINCL